MNKEADTLVILSPGFPADENDTACLPERQVFVKGIIDIYPQLRIVILSFQYPYKNERYYWHGAEVIPFNGQNKRRQKRGLLWMRVWNELNRIRKKEHIICIMNFWLGECSLVGTYFSRIYRIKHFTWVLGQDARKPNKFYKYIRPKAASLIAISDFLSRQLQKNFKIEPAHVISPGINEDLFSKIEGEERSIDILGAGSLIPLKQFELFIMIIKNVQNDIAGLKAVLCGKGPEKENLANLIKKEGLENVIDLIDEQPHKTILKLMQQSKVLLHTSSYEGFGMVCMEAVYAGATVLSFNKPMNVDIPNWYTVTTAAEMEKKLIEILKGKPLLKFASFPYTSALTAKKTVELFM